MLSGIVLGGTAGDRKGAICEESGRNTSQIIGRVIKCRKYDHNCSEQADVQLMYRVTRHFYPVN